MQSILDLVMARLRPSLHDVPAQPLADDCFYGDPLAFLGERGARFGRHQLGRNMGDHFSWEWLAGMSTEPAARTDNFIWLSTLVDRRTFSLWAMLEFASFLRDPVDLHNEARLMAVARRSSDADPALSMNFVKAVWQGFFHTAEAGLGLVSSDWDEVDERAFPSLVDVRTLERLKPVARWPEAESRWAGFIEAHGRQSLRIAEDRLRMRQIAALARPARVYGGANIGTHLGRHFLNPPMPTLRPLKDGFKGSATQASALALLMAACGADRVFTARYPWDATTRSDHRVEERPRESRHGIAPGFATLVTRWRERRADVRSGGLDHRRFTLDDPDSLCRLKCGVDRRRPMHFAASGSVGPWLPSDGRAVPVIVIDTRTPELPPQRGVAYEFKHLPDGDGLLRVETYPGPGSRLPLLWSRPTDPLDVELSCHALRTVVAGLPTLLLAIEVRPLS